MRDDRSILKLLLVASVMPGGSRCIAFRLLPGGMCINIPKTLKPRQEISKTEFHRAKLILCIQF
jgi:hypothetical protein